MAEAIEFITLGVCGLGAVVVTGMALFSSPTRISTSKPRQLSFVLDDSDDGTETKSSKYDNTALASRS